MESSKVQARSFQKEIEQNIFAKHAHHEDMTRWHVHDSRELDRIRKSMHEKSKHRLKKPSRIRDGLENRLQGRHFASQITSETLWGSLGALERMSECSRDALGAFQGHSWDVPGMLRSALGTSSGRFWRRLVHLWAAMEAHFVQMHSHFHGNVVSGLIFNDFLHLFAVLARIFFAVFRSFV